MSRYEEAALSAGKILQEYELCEQCLGRLFSKRLHLSSNRLLGRRLLDGRAAKSCHICRGLFGDLNHYARLMADASSEYEFSSFMVGCMVKPSIIDRDDQVRSRYRLRGADGVKTDITRELAKMFSRRTRARADPMRPDLTLIVDTKGRSCSVHSRSVVVSGRYVKTKRGITQKQKPCHNCAGGGCAACDWHGLSGFESVEGQISEFLFGKLGGTVARFTWVGGEDKSSLVLGSGRPFFARIQNPRRRKLRTRSKALDSVRLGRLGMVSGPPRGPLRFVSSVRMSVSAAGDLKKLKGLAGATVAVYEKSGRRSEKKIYSVRYRKKRKAVEMMIRADGGLPIKRFVSGDEVSPGISQVLGARCACLEFDFVDVSMITIN
ncbi:MAG: pseudouridine synthase [Nitrosopumilus sp. H8]|nr:MAG: pseudouridine synthase [Nitrosopumilus sp. H8]